MSPGRRTFTVRCIAGSSAGAPALFRARTAEGGLADEGPRATRQDVLGGSVGCVRLRHRVRHQAPDGRLLRSAQGSGMLRSVPPSAGHGAVGPAPRGFGPG